MLEWERLSVSLLLYLENVTYWCIQVGGKFHGFLNRWAFTANSSCSWWLTQALISGFPISASPTLGHSQMTQCLSKPSDVHGSPSLISRTFWKGTERARAKVGRKGLEAGLGYSARASSCSQTGRVRRFSGGQPHSRAALPTISKVPPSLRPASP